MAPSRLVLSVRYAALSVAVILVLFALAHRHSENSDAQVERFTKITSAVKWPWHSVPFSKPSPASNVFPDCDPYLAPGYLTVNLSHDGTFWTPFDPACQRCHHYLPDLIERNPMPWLQGKTVVLIGDSVDRNNVRFFCEWANASEHLRITSSTDLREADMDAMNDPEGPKTHPKPRVCRIEEYDFELINFFHYGIEEGDLWREHHTYLPPGPIEERMKIFQSLLENYGRSPDLLLINSGLWDLATFAKLEAYDNLPYRSGIYPQHLETWLQRAPLFVDMIEDAFPGVPMFWRTLHYCVDKWGTWFIDTDSHEGADRTTERAPGLTRRVYEMNRAYERLFELRPQLNKFIWGQLLTGPDILRDDNHPNYEISAVLWIDMILYYLQRLSA